MGSVVEYGGYLLGSVDGGPPTVGLVPKRLQGMRDIQVPKSKKHVQLLLGSFRTFSAYNPECALVTPF